MSTNLAWRGAVEFSGFPVNVALWGRVRKQRNESFRGIAPSGLPVKSKLIDPRDESEVKEPRKGVEVAPNVFTVIPQDAIDAIDAGLKTTVAQPQQLVPVGTIAWDLAIDRFAVRPDEKVAGSDSSVNILWNGLLRSGLAYVTQVSLRGGHDAILALYADVGGFWAALLPFDVELYDVPTHEFEIDAAASAMFCAVAEQRYDEITGPFDHGAYKSEYRARRQAAIQAALTGATPVVAPTQADEAPKPDLMMALQAAMGTKP